MTKRALRQVVGDRKAEAASEALAVRIGRGARPTSARPTARLSGEEVKQHLRIYPPAVRRIAMELRRVVFREVPGAAEKVAYHCLCYYLPDCIWGVVGGNICMMAMEEDAVILGFIHGYRLEDPEGLLMGKNKYKRHVRIGSVEAAQSPAVAALVRAAVKAAKEASLV